MHDMVFQSAAKTFGRESLSINCHPDIARTQYLVDLAHYADTMSACRDRVQRLLKVFEERVEAKRQELPLLLAIRRKYALVDLRDDRYLGGKMESERAYVISLNPKLKRDDQPDAEQALMRRVILQVRDKAEPTLILHYHPKLREQPLRYMAVTLEVSGALNAKEVYVFDTHSTDVPINQDERATERFNEIDYHLRSKLRSLLLHDMLSKLKQEGVEDDHRCSVTGTLHLEKLLKLSLKFSFASHAEDIKEAASESGERLISHKLMLKVILNVAE